MTLACLVMAHFTWTCSASCRAHGAAAKWDERTWQSGAGSVLLRDRGRKEEKKKKEEMG